VQAIEVKHHGFIGLFCIVLMRIEVGLVSCIWKNTTLKLRCWHSI